jgi:hypothetical protein
MLVLGSPASAAGVDSRSYSCAGLQALVRQHGFVFLNNPDFEDFVVAGQEQCGSATIVQWGSVPATDNPQCLVNYCVTPHVMGGD